MTDAAGGDLVRRLDGRESEKAGVGDGGSGERGMGKGVHLTVGRASF